MSQQSLEINLAVRTKQRLSGRVAHTDGIQYDLRDWSCTLFDGRTGPSANSTQLPYIREAEFHLHETFDNPNRAVKHSPFRVQERGWGEFDLGISIWFVDCPRAYHIVHDLNFQEGESYVKRYDFVVPNPSSRLLAQFNKHSTVSRKTVPARSVKSHKAPPPSSSAAKPTSSPAGRDRSSDSCITSSSSDNGRSRVPEKRREIEEMPESKKRYKSTASQRKKTSISPAQRQIRLANPSPTTDKQRKPHAVVDAAGIWRRSHSKSAIPAAKGRQSAVQRTHVPMTESPATNKRIQEDKQAVSLSSLPGAGRTTPPAVKQQAVLAASLAGMKVPKKKSALVASTVAPMTKEAQEANREAFVRERERKRQMEYSETKDLNGDSMKKEGGAVALGKLEQRSLLTDTIANNYKEETNLSSGTTSAATKKEFIRENAFSMDEDTTMEFLILTHRLRVQQGSPEQADSVTKLATEEVENDGIYSLDLSTLNSGAIHQLWTFIKQSATA